MTFSTVPTSATASTSPLLTPKLPTVSVTYGRTGETMRTNELGMRPMQQRVWAQRGEHYLLIKSPPASGKSRALKYVALEKLRTGQVRQVLVVVPERTIGASFQDEPLSEQGFFVDWRVQPRWNLCGGPGAEESEGKVAAVRAFLASEQREDRILVCTHATFRFALGQLGTEAFDGRLIAVDEFHHVSVNPNNRLGEFLRALIARDRVHIVAMTGSYFRGDSAAVLYPEDEARFQSVTYTYYEQLNGYEHLKRLDIAYYFYTGRYLGELGAVLDPNEKTIVHIPSVQSGESTKDKYREVDAILDLLGESAGEDEETGFRLVRTRGSEGRPGRLLRVADLVEDTSAKREKVIAALRDPSKKTVREHVDIIIALGMAKEGFDWIWCEHALTVGYRSSLTEVVQIIGRTTRDAPGKARVRFTNLIAALDASEEAVKGAVNDTLKAIGASLLMEQVLIPRFDFQPAGPPPVRPGEGPPFVTGGSGVGPIVGPGGGRGEDIGPVISIDETTGKIVLRIRGLAPLKSTEAKRICEEDLDELIADVVQDPELLKRALFDENVSPPQVTISFIGRIIRENYPQLDEHDQEAVRQRAVAKLALVSELFETVVDDSSPAGGVDVPPPDTGGSGGGGEGGAENRTTIIDQVERYALNVRELSVDMIDQMNPFGHAYAILSKAMDEKNLRDLHELITARRPRVSPEDAVRYAKIASEFPKTHGRWASLTSKDLWERTVAEGAAAYMRYTRDGVYAASAESPQPEQAASEATLL